MNAVIRTDSSERIGNGHLMRCLTLADRMHRDGMSVHFICRDLAGNLSRLVTAQGFALHPLPPHDHDTALTGYAAWLTVPQEVDSQETIEILRGLRPVERLVVDHYALDAAWEQRMRSLVRELFVIDDLANRPHDCDILLDQNFYRDMGHRYDGLVPPQCKLLLGPKHALLRREFYEVRENMRPRTGEIRRILIFYGGSDPTGETEKAIRALLMLERSDIEADVIVGGSNARRQEIEALCAAAHDFLHYHCQVDNMAEFMARADLCLGAGGTTTWERCFLGLPAIVTAVAKNQIRLCEDAAAAGYIRYLGSSANVRQEDICNALRLALQEGLNLCSPFADKAGGSPAAQTDRLYLRDTVAHDAELLYRWRNDETVRRNAFHTEQIGFSEHLCWFEKTLNDPSAHIFILMCGDMPAGQVRINARDGAYVISYSIGAEFRGQGCGACMLTLLERRMRCGAPGAVLTAQVKKDNMPSRRTFEKLGYQCEVEHDYYSYTKRL